MRPGSASTNVLEGRGMWRFFHFRCLFSDMYPLVWFDFVERWGVRTLGSVLQARFEAKAGSMILSRKESCGGRSLSHDQVVIAKI